MNKRTDIHRPSAINPAEYTYIGYQYLGSDPFMMMAVAAEHRRVNKVREEMGAIWSGHEHGGNCHVCGAWCVHCVVWHHQPTNTFIRTGEDCAAKMDMGNLNAFKSTRNQIKDWAEAKAGQRKALIILWELGIPEAGAYAFGWLDKNNIPRECTILNDLISSLIKYGNWSEKQIAFARKLTATIPNLKAINEEKQAKRAAEEAAAMDAPTGKTGITGTILSSKTVESQFGEQLKMLVKDDRGFKVWTTVPANITDLYHSEFHNAVMSGTEFSFNDIYHWLKNRKISFVVTIEPSKDDKKFGFGKRPTKATLL